MSNKKICTKYIFHNHFHMYISTVRPCWRPSYWWLWFKREQLHNMWDGNGIWNVNFLNCIVRLSAFITVHDNDHYCSLDVDVNEQTLNAILDSTLSTPSSTLFVPPQSLLFMTITLFLDLVHMRLTRCWKAGGFPGIVLPIVSSLLFSRYKVTLNSDIWHELEDRMELNNKIQMMFHCRAQDHSVWEYKHTGLSENWIASVTSK